jgi:hypothetical protein
MDAESRESTQDWLLPEHARPPLIGELERRIEEALVTARASEAAVITVGAAAIDAAEQARRAAELAESASIAAVEAKDAVSVAVVAHTSEAEPQGAAEEDEGLGDFSARADRLVERLRQLQRVPLGGSAASDAAVQPRFAG